MAFTSYHGAQNIAYICKLVLTPTIFNFTISLAFMTFIKTLILQIYNIDDEVGLIIMSLTKKPKKLILKISHLPMLFCLLTNFKVYYNTNNSISTYTYWITH